MQMFYVFLLLNQTEAAADMQARALQHRRVYRLIGNQTPKLRLLVLMGPGNMQDNTPIDFVVHDSVIQTEILYLLPDEAVPTTLPLHDVTFIALGESSRNASLLAQLDTLLPAWPTPVINHPRAIRNCARDSAYELIHNIPGVLMPVTKKRRQGEALEMEFPLTLRPIDTQGGTGLQRIDQAEALAGYYADFPAEAYYAAHYVDYQSGDGNFRKLRIVLIDGAPYICHMAISTHWMVHYLSAGMENSPAKRLEEQQMMESFEQNFAVRFREPLAAIAQALQLDYVTIDCAISHAGELLVFEADSRGLIHASDPTYLYPYKPAVMQKAFDAFQALLFKRVT
jgi:glutathione synthase/RimK-type ligase-like ATP-grasp enzyme